MATVAFAWQIYFDFSGYSDMARGIARMMGYRLMLNFRHPYLAEGLGDFWSRWHISLSTWFRDYVYVPLGGSHVSTARTYRNVWLTMVISGFWHGASWNFVVWGIVHGTAACLLRGCERSDWYRQRIPIWLKRFIVFLVVCVAWVFFRAATWDDAMAVFSGILAGDWSSAEIPWILVGIVASVWLYQALWESRWKFVVENSIARVALATAMIVYLWLVPGESQNAFIYFQF